MLFGCKVKAYSRLMKGLSGFRNGAEGKGVVNPVAADFDDCRVLQRTDREGFRIGMHPQQERAGGEFMQGGEGYHA